MKELLNFKFAHYLDNPEDEVPVEFKFYTSRHMILGKPPYITAHCTVYNSVELLFSNLFVKSDLKIFGEIFYCFR
jgi:hypothetical protein